MVKGENNMLKYPSLFGRFRPSASASMSTNFDGDSLSICVDRLRS